MPELPEVEVTRLRLMPELTGKRVSQVIVRTARLRLPIPEQLGTILPGLVIGSISRRGKYLLFDCGSGRLIVHLGMTGFLQLLHDAPLPGKHDHIDIVFDGGALLRFHDPRKFGVVDWYCGDPARHPLLAGIGPEPLGEGFDGPYLAKISKNRSISIKQLIMDSAAVAGVGNIYANEALFRAGIRPDRTAGSLAPAECSVLAGTIRSVLEQSVREGSSFRVTADMVAYYPQAFRVYGRGGQPCTQCDRPLTEIRLGNRSTVFCASCQS